LDYAKFWSPDLQQILTSD